MKNRSLPHVAGRNRRGIALRALAAGMLLLPAGAAQAGQCQFFDAGTNELVEGQCSVEYDGYIETIALGDRRAVFVLSERQGQWAVGTLDGKPAMRYEANRETFSYATQDLKLFVDRNDE